MAKKEFRNRSLFSKLIFSRFIVTIILLLLQVFVLVSLFIWVDEYATYIIGSFSLLSILLIIYIVNNKENPSYKLSWILLIAISPVLGSLVYLYFKTNIGSRIPKKHFKQILEETKSYGMTDPSVKASIADEAASFQKIAHYIENTGGYGVYKNTNVAYYPLGEDCFAAMKIELEKAKQFIFMEYFIIEEGEFWNTLLEILERKVKEGVEVRLMYDDLGCVTLLPRTYLKTLCEKGIQAKAFSRIEPLLSTHYNNRDHRKIMVVDGKVAFNGGINLADEYINKKAVYGHWKDTAYKVTGDGVRGYTQMFLQMWHVGHTETLEASAFSTYLDASHFEEVPDSEGYVIPFGDGPHQFENVAENVYMDIIHSAEKYVDIMSPYLILDNEMLQSILHAAKRGVRVRLLLPHIPDKWFAIVIARSYYPELIEAGVEVYQYTPGFVHAKMFLADDTIALVGTINLDFRSLYLHYECGGLFYKNSALEAIVKDFDTTFAVSQRMTFEMYKKMPLIDRIAGHILKLIAPLM